MENNEELGLLPFEADIFQSVRCNVCHRARADDSNTWWEVWMQDNIFLFRLLTVPIIKTKAYVCGYDHLFKLLNDRVHQIIKEAK